MLCYKQLWTVEQTFRTAKDLLATRPIFHKLDETIRGHVFCSFLALVLKSELLEERIAGFGRSGSWPEIIADLGFTGPRPRSSTTANASSFARHVRETWLCGRKCQDGEQSLCLTTPRPKEPTPPFRAV